MSDNFKINIPKHMNTSQIIKKFWNNPDLWKVYRLYEDDYKSRWLAVKEMLPVNIDKILDVGTGIGEIVSNISNSYSNVTALDISIEALKNINCILKVNGEIENLPFKSNNFDLIICMEVLEHLSDTSFRRGLLELQRVADKYLLIGVPYKENINLRKTRCPSCGRVFNADGHFRTFNSLRSLCRWFPQFELVNNCLIGPSIQRYTLLGMWVQHMIVREYLPWESYFTCLYCGFNDSYTKTQKKIFKQKVARKINLLLSSKKKLPYWKVVLLKRKN